jgi:uncharacterized ion transporter superfamily protein YfcC
MFKKDEGKNYSLLKIIGATFLLFVVLTWIIPTGSFSGSEFSKGDITPVGLYGLFKTPIYAFSILAQYFILILSVGGFYGVMNKTAVYQRIVDVCSKKSKVVFLIISIITFALITSVFGETMMVFVLLPFFITVLLKQGNSKLVSLASTIGASLIGMIASISGNLAIYKNYFNLEGNSTIIYNIIMLIVLVFLLVMYLIPKTKDKVKNSDNIPLFVEEKKNKKSIVPLSVIMIFTVVLLILGLFNWKYSFGIVVFDDLYTWISGIQLFGTDIFGKIFGEILNIGSFNNYDISVILIIVSLISAWVYNIKFNDFIDSFISGAKEMIVPGIYLVLASIIFSNIVTSSGGNISITISNFVLGLFTNYNIFTGILSGILGSFFYNDYVYFLNGLYSKVSLYDGSDIPVILTVYQSIHGLMMMILPVSMSLVFGLKFLGISYKEWLKFMWKFLVQLFAIIIIGSVILNMIV